MSQEVKIQSESCIQKVRIHPEIVTLPVVKKIASAYKEDSEVVSFTSKLATKPGDNYMSIIYSVKILLKNGPTFTEDLDIMLKAMPRAVSRQEMINEMAAFVKEGNMYTQVFPEIIKFQELRLLKSELFSCWPTCYATFHDGANDYLALEDLRGQGFSMADRTNGLSPHQIRSVLKNLAYFHAISYSQFGGDSSKIMETYPWLEEKLFPTQGSRMTDPDSMKTWMTAILIKDAEILRTSGYAEQAELILHKLCSDDEAGVKLWDDLHTIVSGGMDGQNAVINHGDCWTNNILFNGETHRVKLLDFQLARCAPRSVDISYFLYSSVPLADLERGEDGYLRWYHDHFVEFLRDKLGLKGEGLTWTDFMEEWNQCRIYGVIWGLVLAPIMSAEPVEICSDHELNEEDIGAYDIGNLGDEVTSSKEELVKRICYLAVNILPKCPQIRI